MARLAILGARGEERSHELRLGLNRIGRAPDNDLTIDHATISGHHCELILGGDGVTVRDLESTNGTFVDGQPARETVLHPGQKLRLGSVDLQVDFSEVNVVIPQFQPPSLPPILKVATGESVCLRHQGRQAAWKCTYCDHLFCTPCVHRIRRRGGRTLYLCPDCSFQCELLPEFVKARKRSFLGVIADTIKIPIKTAKKMLGGQGKP